VSELLRDREVPRGSWWWLASAITVALILGLGALGILRALVEPLAVIFVGMTLAATLAPIVSWLARWMPRTVAAIAVYLALLLILALILWILVPPLARQAQQLAESLPGLAMRAEQLIERWQRMTDGGLEGSLDTAVTGLLTTLGSLAASAPGAIVGLLAAAALVIVVSVYWLILSPRINNFVRSLFPPAQGQRIEALLSEMAGAMGGTYVGLLILGIDYPLVLAVLAGLLEFIPMLGPIVAAVAITGVALTQSLTSALLVLVFMIGVQQLESQVLTPNIMRTQTHLSPLLTVVALFVGAAVGGFLGVLVSIPLTAALRVLAVRALAPAIRRRTGAPPPEQDDKSEEEAEEG
jgi:predicted PurR-regulated permease PerM